LKKLIAIFAACMLLTGVTASAVLAAPSFTFTVDDQGANDEPGQKDLTAQSSASDAGVFYTAWKWDETAWSGNNTGDGCSLFDTDDDDLTNYALCATISKKNPVVLNSFVLYQCSDGRADRCTNPTALVTKVGATAANYCTVTDKAAGAFDAQDTLIVCNISAIAAEAGITVFGTGTLLNTCSYPSREPNSDPSDCVLTIQPPTVTDTNTTPGGSATFSATLTDSATVSPSAVGSVVFNLYSDALCTTLVYTSGSVALVAGAANTSTTTSVAGTYYWTVDFTPTDPTAFDPSSSTCGEEVITVVAPTVS